MEPKIESFNQRVLMLENYSAPLHVLALDSDSPQDERFQTVLSQIFLLPSRQVMQHEDWTAIGKTITQAIQSDDYIGWLSDERLLRGNEKARAKALARFDEDRQELTRKLAALHENPSFFAFTAIRNVIYLASEGPILFDPYGETDAIVPVSPTIRRYIFNRLVAESELPQDAFSFWLRTTNLLLQPISQSFKFEFQNLFKYDIPFGLSPKTKSETIESLLANANKIAIVPLIQGATEVGGAITAHNWAVAIQAAATSGAAVIILLSAIAVAERIFQWKKSKSETPKK